MDFETAANEAVRIEKDSVEYTPLSEKGYKAERALEFSPRDINELNYADAVNLYLRIDKILRASSLEAGLLGEEAPSVSPSPLPSAAADAEAVGEQMKRIGARSAKESEEISTLPVVKESGEGKEAEEEAVQKPPVPPAAARPAVAPPKKEEAGSMEEEFLPEGLQETVGEGERPPETKPGEGAGKAAPEPGMMEEEPSAPPAPPVEAVSPGPEALGKMQIPGFELPNLLKSSPLLQADEALSRLEAQLGAQMTGKKTKKVDVGGTKKRMLELTRELFKERSMDRRAEIKKEIVALKALLTKSGSAKAGAGGLPKGSLFNALLTEQEYELKQAKEGIQSLYAAKQKSLVSAMEAQRAVEHREAAFESFSRSMAELEHNIISIIEHYQNFLVAKHTSELSKLAARGQATPESGKRKASLRQEYAHQFSSLKDSIGEDVHSQIDTTRAVLIESAGDPSAREMAQIANAPEENMFTFLQAKDSRTYEKYARGEISRSQALSIARRLMAKDSGVDEDTINKRFGIK